MNQKKRSYKQNKKKNEPRQIEKIVTKRNTLEKIDKIETREYKK